jgi:hypothetical protein
MMYLYILIAIAIGIIIGSVSCLCVYDAISITDNKLITGGGNNVTKTPINKNNELFTTLMPKLNNFGLDGHNINNYNNFQKI